MIEDYFKESIILHDELFKDKAVLNAVNKSIKQLKNCFADNKKILIAGNGGSAADAQHFAAEIVCRFKKERKGYPALALTVNPSIITA